MVLAGAVLVLAGCAHGGTPGTPGPPAGTHGVVRTAGCATATSPPATSIDGTPQPANQNDLDELANRLQPYAQAHFADAYTGVELRSEQDRIRVYRKASAAFDAWVLREFAASCVEIVDARYTAVELTGLVQRISADAPYWQSLGVPMNLVSVNPDGSGIQVGTTEVERARRELARRYGTGIAITVVYAEPVVAY